VTTTDPGGVPVGEEKDWWETERDAQGRYRVQCDDCKADLWVYDVVTLPPHGCTDRQRRIRESS
jgi:hypothetical protein